MARAARAGGRRPAPGRAGRRPSRSRSWPGAPRRSAPAAADESLADWLARIAQTRSRTDLVGVGLRRPARRRRPGRSGPARLRGHGGPPRRPARRGGGAGLPRRRRPAGAQRVKVAIGADHAGVDLKAHLVTELRAPGPRAARPGHARHGVGRLPADLRGGRARGRRRRGRAGHRARRLRPGRADRGQQGPRRPGRPVQRPVHRPAQPRAQRRQRAGHGRPHRRRRAWPPRSSSSGSPRPFDGGRHERRVAQIADIETEEGTS